ncbi:MAG: YHS domain-containing protein [Myxococcota bacterium]
MPVPLDPTGVPPPDSALDPVCGARVTPAEAPLPVLFRGARWWFCSSSCRMAFKRDAAAYADARPDAGVPVRPVVPPVTRKPGPFRVTSGRAPDGDGNDEGGGL